LTTAQATRPERTLCSAFSTASNEDAAGSAFSWKRCLIVEVPDPWTSDVAQSRNFPPGVSEVLAAAEGTDTEVKLQCVLPDDEYSREGHTRVLLFSRPQGMFARFDKDEYLVPTDRVSALVEGLTTGPEKLAEFAADRQDTGRTRDILVCTHGSHDTCCGTFGYRLYEALRNRGESGPGGDMRVFRVNHLGGHRFAPNVVDMPEGRNWVRLGIDQIDDVLSRKRPPADLKQFHRGWTGLDTPQEQSAEQEILVREGWSWAARLKSGTVLEPGDNGSAARVRIDFADADGGNPGAYEATVEQLEDAPRVECPSGERSGGWWQFKVTELTKTK
jgi:hypothetical protein